MFRTRRVYDDTTPANKQAIAQVQEILRAQFPGLPKKDVNKLPKQLQHSEVSFPLHPLYYCRRSQGTSQGVRCDSAILYEKDELE